MQENGTETTGSILRRLVKTTEEEKESASHWIWSLFGYHSDRNTLRI